MTSHIINRVGERDRKYVDDCVFCDIAAHRQSAYIVAESSSYVAFLDVLPIRTGKLRSFPISNSAGHTVVIPKSHVSRLSSMCPAQASAMMQGVTAVARAMEEGMPPYRKDSLSIRDHRLASCCKSGVCSNHRPRTLLDAHIL